jgi:uncharacterized protein YidB (DUF937 family)
MSSDFLGGKVSWLKGILGGVIGAEALSLIKDYFEKKGGVENVVKEFQNAGFGDKIASWVSTGPNHPINLTEIQKAIGRTLWLASHESSWLQPQEG